MWLRKASLKLPPKTKQKQEVLLKPLRVRKLIKVKGIIMLRPSSPTGMNKQQYDDSGVAVMERRVISQSSNSIRGHNLCKVSREDKDMPPPTS